MNLAACWHAAAHHGMRAYYLPLAAGVLLSVSAFLPWMILGGTSYGGVPDISAFWVLGLGILAALLAALSIATRRNSRHPLLVVGLAALGILFVAYRLMRRMAAEQAWAASQALAIVDGVEAPAQSPPAAAAGLYVGVAASVALILFGLTIVVKRVKQPYAEPEDDDA